MAIKFREILFTMFCAASAAMLLIFIPLAILLSPSAGYASLGYHPYLFQLLLYGLFIPTVLATAGYGLVKFLRKQSKKRLQSRLQGHRPTDEQIALYETIRKQHQTEKEDMDKAMLSAIRQYIEITLSPYMKDAALTLFIIMCISGIIARKHPSFQSAPTAPSPPLICAILSGTSESVAVGRANREPDSSS